MGEDDINIKFNPCIGPSASPSQTLLRSGKQAVAGCSAGGRQAVAVAGSSAGSRQAVAVAGSSAGGRQAVAVAGSSAGGRQAVAVAGSHVGGRQAVAVAGSHVGGRQAVAVACRWPLTSCSRRPRAKLKPAAQKRLGMGRGG